MGVFFTADPHFGHANIIQFCKRPFNTVTEMDATILENINAAVGRYDRLYILGDFCLVGRQSEHYLKKCVEYRRRIECPDVVLIVGNHDRPKLEGFRELFTEIHDLLDAYVEDQRITLCHYAMRVWNQSHRGAWQLYGHDHGTLADDPKLLAFDVGVDCWDFKPLSFRQVREVMAKRTEAGPTTITPRVAGMGGEA